MSRKKVEFKPINRDEVGLYTCGPTVYNYAHIGNFRAYMFEDLLRRTLEYHGYKVKHIMNFTDVDDKTIRDSSKAGIPLNEFTEKFKKAFIEDIDTLKIKRATHYPAATEHIQEMIDLINVLFEKGYAYLGDDGSVYFSISKFKDYGKLARIDMENQRSVERIKNDEYAKDSVADFALWKKWTESDGDVAWDSPWGRGRPGWHIECSAMSMKYLGKTFDLHTGGIDNMFPHHEDEIAQSEAANGCRFVNYWLHCGYLNVNGEKMSKSLGNFYTLRDLTDKCYTPEEIRFVLIGTHYRKKLDFSEKALMQARKNLATFREFFVRLKSIDFQNSNPDISALLLGAEEQFGNAIADDLNISKAFAVMHTLMRDINKLINAGNISQQDAVGVLDLYKKFDEILKVLNIDEINTIEKIPVEIEEFLELRIKAREMKNFEESDRIRDVLKEKGWIVEDSPEGQKVKKA
jgi:cysteinyl-tRNA synthetase